MAAPLVERKRVLQSFLSEAATASPLILYSEHFEDGPDLYARASAISLEGIVSKRADAPYRSGRGEQWIKVIMPEARAVKGFLRCVFAIKNSQAGHDLIWSPRGRFGFFLLERSCMYSGRVRAGFCNGCRRMSSHEAGRPGK